MLTFMCMICRAVIGNLAQLLLCVMCLSIAHARAQNHTKSSSFGLSAILGEHSDIAVLQYTNNYDGVLDFTCPHGYGVYYINSVHSNYYEDRKWNVKCRKMVRIGYPVTCEWREADTWSWDGNLRFTCPGNQFLSGLYSSHSNHYNDRYWKFYCCSAPCHTLGTKYNSATNSYDGAFTRELSDAESVFTGMNSHTHNNYYE